MFVAACFCLLGAVRAEDTQTSPEKMTALVGSGCVINQIDKSLIDVFGQESSLSNLLDTNIDNYASLSGLANIDVGYHQIISVKDVEHEYAGGVETGFVMQSVSDGTNLLTADVLKLFVIETYFDGEKQESSVYDDATGGLLDLNLITIAEDGKTRVSIRTTKPFDEVRLAVAGVNVEAFSQLRLYYAYVGANEMHPITQTLYYPEASVHGHQTTGLASSWTSAVWNWPNQKEKLVGKDSETDGVGFGTLGSLLTEPRVTIDAGKTIPVNTEVGFVIESGSVLAINLLENTVLTTYDADDNEVESKTIVSVLGLSALSGGKTTVSLVTTKPCQQIKIKFGGLNIDVGGTKIYHAYTRDASVFVKEQCDLKLSADIAVCSQNSYQLSGVSGIVWSVEEQPAGANATVSSTGLVENMTIEGTYVIKAQKGDCVGYVVINNTPSANISNECNRPIVGDDVYPFTPEGGGCLLCLSPDLDEGALNVVDTDLSNYIEYTKGLDLLSNTSIYGVEKKNGRFEASEDNPRRVGFVMQATDQFLAADVLKFFVIKTYLNGVLQESSPVDENDAVTASLIGGLDNQMRFSFVATKPFNQVTIWTAGVLSLNLSKYRIYYAFEEPATSTCLDQYSANACLTMLSAGQHGASIDYERTGFNGVANIGATMRDLAYVVDNDINTAAYIGKTAGVAANTTLAIKTNQVFEHGYQAGFVVKEQTWLGNVDLLRLLRIKTFLNGVETGDENLTPEVLSLDLIGGSGKSLITVTPTKPFDEIMLDMSGLVDALVELHVFGAFVQSDIDGDGIPDCLDKNPCGEELFPACYVSCGATHADVLLSGTKDGYTYTLWDGQNVHEFVNGVASFDITPGLWNCTIRENGVDVYNNFMIEVHPKYTVWKGTNSSDWYDWENWSNGVPGECTNVLIPSVDSLDTANGIHYPELETGSVCNGIYLKPGAELVQQNLLNYNKAWVALNIYPEKNNMVSVPLKETFSGDFFVYKKSGDSEALQQDFKNPLLTDTLVGNVNRIVPFVTTSIWENQWTSIRTQLDQKQNPGSGIAVSTLKNRYVTDPSTPLEIIFGKEDMSYDNVNASGKPATGTSTINRIAENIGRFAFDSDTLHVTLSGVTGQATYVVGNPFVCHLDVDAFKTYNDIVKSVKVADIENNPNAEYSQSTELGSGAKIAPTRSFFVETNTPTETLNLVFTPEMMTSGDYNTAEQTAPQTRSAKSNTSGITLANIKAYTENGEGVIAANETIKQVQVVTAAGQVLTTKRPESTSCRVALASGVNFVKVTTENGEQTFKLTR